MSDRITPGNPLIYSYIHGIINELVTCILIYIYIYIHIYVYIHIYSSMNMLIYIYIYTGNLGAPKAGHTNKRKTLILMNLYFRKICFLKKLDLRK